MVTWIKRKKILLELGSQAKVVHDTAIELALIKSTIDTVSRKTQPSDNPQKTKASLFLLCL
jgi:hypothetical protein